MHTLFGHNSSASLVAVTPFYKNSVPHANQQGAVTVHMKQIISKLTSKERKTSIQSSKATHVRRSVPSSGVYRVYVHVYLNRHHVSFSHCAYAHTQAIYTPACAYDGNNLLRLCHRRKAKARDANANCACAIAKEAWYQISRGKNGASATRGSS